MRLRFRRRLLAAAAAALLVPLAPIVATGPAAAADTADWLHTAGNKIVDSQGNEVWLTGTNWFGFNATERVFHGLWSGNITEITKAMADRGINIVRVPISTQLLLEWKAGQAAVPSGVNTYANPELLGRTTLQVFDYFLALCQQFGIKVMLDVHSAEADNSGHIYPVWWKGSVTPELFYQAWEWVIDRYRTNDTLVAADVKNEPHGKWNESLRAKWDNSTDQDNFKNTCQVAGNRILAKNPNMLILCEGIEIFPKNGTNWSSTAEADYYGNWWGGNLRGVKNHPVDLGNHIVYSPHDYGPLVWEQPWFQKPFDKATLTADVWTPNWLYIHNDNTAPLLVGEWGGRLGQDARQDTWMYALRDTIIEKRISQTFWVLNPNSGDTGGLLLDDWKTWDEAKYAMLKPALWSYQNRFVGLDHQVKLGANGMSLTDRYGGTSDTVAPSVPTGLAVAGTTTGSVSLTWTASTDNSGTVAGYDVYRGATKVGTSATPSYVDTGLAAGTTYSYTVRAFDAAGNVSAASAARTATTTTGPADTVAPSVPAGLAVTGTTTGSVSLTWAASSDNSGTVAGYDVYRGGAKVGTSATPSYVDTGLAPGTAYTYAVRAFDAAGNVSALSAAVTGTTRADPAGAVRVQYRNNSVATNDQEIKPVLRVVNGGTGPLALSTVTVRYYFTRDGGGYTIWCDWAAVGCGTLATRVVPLATPVAGADAYIEVAFTGGSVAAGADTGEIQLRVSRTDWQQVNEANDYSRGAGTSFADAPAVPAFVGGSLAWGTVPA